MAIKLTVKKWLKLISESLGVSEEKIWERCLYFDYDRLDDDGIQIVSIDWTKEKELEKFKKNEDLPIAVVYPNFEVENVEKDTLNDRLIKDLTKLNQGSKHFEYMMRQKVTYKSFALYKSKLLPVVKKIRMRYKSNTEKNVMVIGKNRNEIKESIEEID